MQMTVLQDTVAPYREVKISWLSTTLGMEAEQCEALLVRLILSNKLDATIDQHAGFLVMNAGADVDPAQLKYKEISRWADALANSMAKVCAKAKASSKHESGHGGGLGRHFGGMGGGAMMGRGTGGALSGGGGARGRRERGAGRRGR